MNRILSIKDSIVKIKSSQEHFINQIVIFNKKHKGIIIEVDEKHSHILVDSDKNIQLTSTFTVDKKPWNVQFDKDFLGKIINVNDEILYLNKPKLKNSYQRKYIFNKSPLFFNRAALNEPLKTGLFAIDTLIPIGKGQRELIIGDRKTGKTSIALSTIINQRNENVKVIYVSIGQRQSSLREMNKIFQKHNVNSYITIINASSELKLSQFLAPYLGMAIAESIASNNEDALVVFDDLSKHANIIREIALNLGKSGGREAYPSNLFYSHSKLLERSGKFKKNVGGGSISALPIVETIEGDFSTILATNIISITDGQIMTDYKKSKNSDYPAINIGLSVSRTGNSVQSKLLKNVNSNISKIYSDYISSQKYELISLEISKDIKHKIIKGKILNNAFKQFGYEGMDEKQMFVISKMIENNILKESNAMSLYNRINNNSLGKKLINNFLDNPNKYDELFKAYCQMIVGKPNAFNGKCILSKEGNYE